MELDGLLTVFFIFSTPNITYLLATCLVSHTDEKGRVEQEAGNVRMPMANVHHHSKFRADG